MLKNITYGYRILTKRTNSDFKPLPNMLQYFLYDDSGREISFWNDVPINLKEDSITCGV